MGEGLPQGSPGWIQAAAAQGRQKLLGTLLHPLPLGLGKLQHVTGTKSPLPFLKQALQMAWGTAGIEAKRGQAGGAGGADQQARNDRTLRLHLKPEVQGAGRRRRSCHGKGPGRSGSIVADSG